jgi:hypothetical protein
VRAVQQQIHDAVVEGLPRHRHLDKIGGYAPASSGVSSEFPAAYWGYG